MIFLINYFYNNLRTTMYVQYMYDIYVQWKWYSDDMISSYTYT